MENIETILATLVSFQTVTGRTQPAHELVEYVADFVRRRGMHVERYMSNGYESLVATTQPNDKTPTVMLAAHGDVVDAPEEEFVLRRDGDKLCGRGVKDMKFALATFLYIIDDLGNDLRNYRIGLMLTMDEEAGGNNGVEVLMKEGYRPTVCLLPDGGEDWQIQTDCKGVWIPRITATGKAAHSARHWLGENALTKLLAVIPELEQLFPTEQSWETNTLSINSIQCGHSLSQVPDRASLQADIRTVDRIEFGRIKQEVTSLCQRYNLQLEEITSGLPTHFDLQDPLIAPFVALIESTTGVKVIGSKPQASNDARFMAPYNIPCISLYIPGEGHHSSDEWVSATALQQFATITRQYLDQIAR